jgi:hypothetical protein
MAKKPATKKKKSAPALDKLHIALFTHLDAISNPPNFTPNATVAAPQAPLYGAQGITMLQKDDRIQIISVHGSFSAACANVNGKLVYGTIATADYKQP